MSSPMQKFMEIHELVRPLLRLLGEHLGALPALYVSSVGRF
jgi:hypothetical protein